MYFIQLSEQVPFKRATKHQASIRSTEVSFLDQGCHWLQDDGFRYLLVQTPCHLWGIRVEAQEGGVSGVFAARGSRSCGQCV
jgi:hypothetical protein